MEAFAQMHGMRAHRLGRWARRLRVEGTAQPTFHAVRVVGAPSFGAEERIEVRLGDVTIRLPSGFAAADLRQVLEVLEGRSSC
jgi:hypothetical protein